MKKICVLLYSIFLLGGFTSCNQETLSDTESINTNGKTRISFNSDIARKVEVKSTGTPDATYENKINNVWVIQFNAEGNIINGELTVEEGTGNLVEYFSSLTDNSIEIRLDNAVAEIWFIANTAQDDLFTEVTSKAEIEEKYLLVTGEASLMPTTNIIMRGKWKTGDEGFTIAMKRAIARVDFSLKTDLPNTDAFAVQSVQVMNVPNILHYFRDPDKLIPEGEITPYPNISATISYPIDEIKFAENELWTNENLQWMPGSLYNPGTTCKGEIISSEGKNIGYWYLPENARGKGHGTNPREKNAENAPDGQCTYIVIKGYYKSGELVSAVTYNVYLGENNTDDYNIISNTNYKVTTTIKGIDRADTRIDKESENFVPQNYIDYTDNSMPWVVYAAGQYNQDIATLPNIPNWNVPTKEEMMLAWIYKLNRVNGFNNIYWVKEATDNTGTPLPDKGDGASQRWTINMGTGTTIINTGGDSGSSSTPLMFRAVKSISSFKYPYVLTRAGENGEDIIVSRDNNGGVKKEYIRDTSADPWSQTPKHNETEDNNIVAAKFEIASHAIQDEGQPLYSLRKTWEEAQTYCETLGEGWRMPTQRELMLIYILNDQLSDPLYDGNDNSNYHIYYWSATEDATKSGAGAESNTGWSVCFCKGTNSDFTNNEHFIITGKTEGYPKSTENYIRCVRDVK